MPGASDRRAATGVTAALVLFTGMWLALLALAERTPPIDNVEQWVWSFALTWGYYKHPPLPTWIAAGTQAVLGRTPLVIDLLGALCAATSFFMFWHLLRRLRGSAFATLALLAVLCLTYSTLRLHYFNHNTVLMPLAAATVLLLWQATVRPWRWSWAAMGLFIGLGMLAKYQIVLVAACVGLWWMRIGGWRHREHRIGALWCALTAAMVFLPHLKWLLASDWAPLAYARQSSLDAGLPWSARPVHALHWLLDWFGNRLLPAWLLLALTAWALAGQRNSSGASVSRCDAATAPPAWMARQFLCLWGFGPPLLMVALCLATGMRLQFKWSTSFALWTVPAVMACLPIWDRVVRVRRLPPATWIGFAAIQLLLAAWLAVSAYRDDQAALPATTLGWSRRDFASAARLVDEHARTTLGGPVQILSGPYGVAGAMAQHLPGPPLVLIDGDLARSPWVSVDQLRHARVVHVAPACQLPDGAFRIMPGWVGRPALGLEQRGFSPAPELWREAVAHGGYSRVRCP